MGWALVPSHPNHFWIKVENRSKCGWKQGQICLPDQSICLKINLSIHTIHFSQNPVLRQSRKLSFGWIWASPVLSASTGDKERRKPAGTSLTLGIPWSSGKWTFTAFPWLSVLPGAFWALPALGSGTASGCWVIKAPKLTALNCACQTPFRSGINLGKTQDFQPFPPSLSVLCFIPPQ